MPIAIRTRLLQSPQRYIRRLYLIVDNNPSPIAANIELTPESGRADLETRIRIEQYSYVRAVAESPTERSRRMPASSRPRGLPGAGWPGSRRGLARRAHAPCGRQRGRLQRADASAAHDQPSQRFRPSDGSAHAPLYAGVLRTFGQGELCRQAGPCRRGRLLDQRKSLFPLLFRALGRRRASRPRLRTRRT